MSETQLRSSASKPDLDWSQVRETINMITLAVAQIESSMRDGEQSVSELTESFIYIASRLNGLEQTSVTLQHSISSPQNGEIEKIRDTSADIHDKVNSAIIAFQFYDRLSQRLEHVKRDLAWLSEVISTPDQLYNPAAWNKLQQDIASNYTLEEERIMFEHIMKGATVGEALEIYRHHFTSNAKEDEDGTGDEIELF